MNDTLIMFYKGFIVYRSTSPTITRAGTPSPTSSIIPIGPVATNTNNTLIISLSIGSFSCLLVFIIIFQCLYYRRRPPVLSRIETTVSLTPILPPHSVPIRLEEELLNDPCDLSAITENPMHHKNVAI